MSKIFLHIALLYRYGRVCFMLWRDVLPISKRLAEVVPLSVYKTRSKRPQPAKEYDFLFQIRELLPRLPTATAYSKTMPPNATRSECTGVLNEHDAETIDGGLAKDIALLKEKKERQFNLVWRNIILFAYVHVAALYGLWLMITAARLYTTLFAVVLYLTSGLGITAGAHRLWAHRSYKAKLPLRILLTVFNTIAFQDCAIHWARDHRVHHKYSETDADPHNATRGFFFSHIGWLLW